MTTQVMLPYTRLTTNATPKVKITFSTSTREPILKHNYNPLLTDFQAPQKLAATTIEIWADMTSSPSSPESPKQNFSHRKAPTNSNEAGVQPGLIQLPTTSQARRIKRSLGCELNHKTRPNHQKDDSNEAQPLESSNSGKDAHWLHTNQLPNERCAPIFPAITLRKKMEIDLCSDGF